MVDETYTRKHTLRDVVFWVDVLGDAYPEGCARAVGIGRLRRLFAVPRRAPRKPPHNISNSPTKNYQPGTVFAPCLSFHMCAVLLTKDHFITVRQLGNLFRISPQIDRFSENHSFDSILYMTHFSFEFPLHSIRQVFICLRSQPSCYTHI